MQMLDNETTRALDVLKAQRLISEDHAKEVLIKERAQRSRILQEKAPGIESRKKLRYDVSAAELIASFKLPLPSNAKELLTEEIIVQALATDAGLTYHKIDPLKLDMRLITSTLSRPFARKHGVLPLSKTGNTLTVAVADPYDIELIENLKRTTSMDIQPMVSTRSDIMRLITEVYGFRTSVAAAEKDFRQTVDLGNLEQYVRLKKVEEIEATDAHVINAVEYLLHYAFEQRASDIHIEPKREISQVRLRIDGMLHDTHTLPRVVHNAVVSRIKMLARMDIAERRRPQDGRIKTDHGAREVELRVSSMPVAFGEKVVIRIFDPELLMLGLDELGFFPEQRKLFESFIQNPHGLLLVTGPTGSGKTTTLYSALRILATPQVNVVTIEDPIEMVIDQFNQVAVQPKVGITFSSALRTILRQDPDIIMVGEIRDAETANNAVQSALTGHLVLSTLHTNDTASSVARLVELKVEPFLVASTLLGVMAQRLVRCVCPSCAEDSLLGPEEMGALQIRVPEGRPARLKVKRGKGCVNCRGTGLYRRTGIFEVMDISEKIRRLITENKDSTELMKTARLDGMMTLREGAIKRLAQGKTSFEEVIRVTAERS